MFGSLVTISGLGEYKLENKLTSPTYLRKTTLTSIKDDDIWWIHSIYLAAEHSTQRSSSSKNPRTLKTGSGRSGCVGDSGGKTFSYSKKQIGLAV